MRAQPLCLAVLTIGIIAGSAVASADVTMTEFAIPTTNARAYGITRGPDGAMWFTEQSGAIGRISPDGEILEFPLPGFPTLYGGPDHIVTGPDGNLWFTGASAARSGVAWSPVVRMTAAGAFSTFFPANLNSRPTGITAGPDGALWYTDVGRNAIGRLTTAGEFTEYALPAGSGSPLGITAGPDGNLWFVEQAGNKVGRMTVDGVLTEFAIPTPNSQPNQITSGPDGALWFGEIAGRKIGRITTYGAITEFPLAGSVSPQGIVGGPDGAVWFVGTLSGQVYRITETGSISSYPIPRRAGSPGVTPVDIDLGADGNLWFTQNTDNEIGRVNLAPPPVIPSISIGDATAAEAGAAVFTLSLSAPTSIDISVGFATSDGSASAGADYTAVSGLITIPAGDVEATVSVTIGDDLDDESDETFFISLSSPVGGVIADGEATGTIIDDDPSHGAVDLSVDAVVAPAPVVVGTEATLTFTVSNEGPMPAHGVTLKITPALRPADVVPGPDATCTQSFSSLDCTWAGELSSGDSRIVAIRHLTTAAGAADYNVQVSSDATVDEETDASDNSAIVRVEVVLHQVDLSVAVSVTPDPVVLGTEATLTLTVRNDGPMAAHGVTVEITPATGAPGPVLTPADVVGGSNATCTQSFETLVCTWPQPIPPGDSSSIAIRRLMDVAGRAEYAVRVSSDATLDLDANAGNDFVIAGVNASATETATATVPANGTLTTDVEGDGATAGDSIETTVTTPVGGTIAIIESPAGTPPAATAWSFLGRAVTITAPAASANDPLTITFRIHVSLSVSGIPAVFRDGVVAGPCTSAAEALPDPCVASAITTASEHVISVRSSTPGEWTFGTPIVKRGRVTGPGFSAQSDGSTVTGELQFRDYRARFDALNVEANTAWIAGYAADGTPFVVYVEDNTEGARDDVYKLWIGGEAVTSLPNGNITID